MWYDWSPTTASHKADTRIHPDLLPPSISNQNVPTTLRADPASHLCHYNDLRMIMPCPSMLEVPAPTKLAGTHEPDMQQGRPETDLEHWL